MNASQPKNPNSDTLADPTVVLELIEAFRRSKVMFAAVELGVFDHLQAGPRSVGELAAALPANEDGLERLMNACVSLGLLTRSDDQYANSLSAATYLTSNSPQRFTGYIKYSNDVMWKLWRHLEDAVREGTHRWQQAYGWDGPIFSHFFRTEEAKREFLMGMHGFGVLSSPQVVAAVDLSSFTRVVDLGGATGHFVIAACERNPHLRGVVFDLPDAVDLAREVVTASSVSDRVEVIGGDFFEDDLPAADLYALGRILHDWSEPKIQRLIRKIYQQLPAGGGILVVEKLLDDDKSGPRWAHMQNLNMLTCTEGKERTLAEYRDLLQAAGFEHIQGFRTDAPIDAVLARKPVSPRG